MRQVIITVLLFVLALHIYAIAAQGSEEGVKVEIFTKIILVGIVDTGTNEIFHPFLGPGKKQENIAVIAQTRSEYKQISQSAIPMLLKEEKKTAIRIIKSKGGIKAVVRNLEKEKNIEFVPAHMDIEWIYSVISKSASAVKRDHPITVNRRLYLGEAK